MIAILWVPGNSLTSCLAINLWRKTLYHEDIEVFNMHFSCCAQLLFLPRYPYFAIVQGEKWHSRRKILTPAFHFKILEGFIQVFNVNSEFLIKDLEAQIGEPFVDINAHITKCTLDIICGKYQCSHCQEHFQYFTLILLMPVSKHQTDAMICLELFFRFCTFRSELISF